MVSVLIVGNGNVAFHLYNALSALKEISVSKISSRNLLEIPKADLTILAVSDNAIAAVSKQITNSLVVHTSGFSPLKTLQNTSRKGVFYPLQSFTKGKDVAFSTIPICIEATNINDEKLLKELAKKLSNSVYVINSEQRKALHVAAVFVNNFTNYMYKIGDEICKKNEIPFEILQPLIVETAKKVAEISPEKAQTGPAIRADSETIKNHLFLLNDHEKEIYNLMTKSIQNGN
jgi:predicted short-subunit dehydrogenase-like oxidoreductase (DUF2520 family)